MTNVYLLKEYEGNSAGNIIGVNPSLVDELVKNGTARQTKATDYLTKPQYVLGAVAKAFKRSPKVK